MVESGVGVVGTEPARSYAAVVRPHFIDLRTLRLDQLFGSGTLRESFRIQALVGEDMKLFHQSVPWAAMGACVLLNTLIRKRCAHWVSALALVVLGMAVVAPLHAETISPRRLLEVTDLDNLVISPDGRY